MKMNMLNVLIASGLISLGAKKANAESIEVPKNIQPVNIEQFQKDLRAPYDSLTVKVGRQNAEIRNAETVGDTTGLRSFRERTKEDSKRENTIGKVVASISDSTYNRFTNFNAAIRDNSVTPAEADNLLSKVVLDPASVNDYEAIAGSQAYAKVDEVVARYNGDVDNLLTLLEERNDLLTSLEEGNSQVVATQTPENKEQDYTKIQLMKGSRLEVIAGSSYGDDVVSFNLGFRAPIYNRARLGLSAEYGEQPGNSSDITLHQRGRLTGFRAEASQVVDKSLLGVSVELAYGNDMYGLVSTGTVKRFTQVKKEESLYDRDNNLLGSDRSENTEEKWYGRFLAGVGYRNGSFGVEGSAGVIGKKNAAARFNINYNF